MGPAVSILIVNWNTRDALLRCLDSLPSAVTDGLPYEVIVVDNASVDGSQAALASRSDIELVQNDANVGFARGVNQAYRCSHGELVLLLNSDVDLIPGSLSALVDFLTEHPDVAGIAPLYLNPDHTPQPFHFRFPSFTTLLASGSSAARRVIPGSERRLRDYQMLDDDFSRPRPVPQPSASCLLLRRSAISGPELLDERYPIFFNDVMLARVLAGRGAELWVTPAASVIHEGHASTRQLGRSGLKRQYLASLVNMLSETESAPKVWFYRALVFGQNVSLVALHRPNALGFGDLVKALSGDPGPLPARPSGWTGRADQAEPDAA